MIDIAALPVVLWPVPCFDRRKEKPFPVHNRWYWLEWSELVPDVAAEIAGILLEGKGKSHSPVGFDSSVVTMSYGGQSYDSRMLGYRKLFREVPNNDIGAFLETEGRLNRGMRQVTLGADYFEDETGTPITPYEMMQHVTGQKQPIIVGDPKSVLALGPAAPKDVGSWNSEKANKIAQFLDVVERIRSSTWFRLPPSVSYLTQASGKQLLEANFAADQETMAILAYFRQLHAGDELLAKAVDAYLEHCGDPRKTCWVSERRRAFVALIDAPPEPSNGDSATRREIVRMFMYGGGLLHSESKHGDDVALQAFVAKHGRHEAVVIFNSCLLDFLRIAVQLCCVIRQDFHHWVANAGLAGPTRIAIQDLFASYPEDSGSIAS